LPRHYGWDSKGHKKLHTHCTEAGSERLYIKRIQIVSPEPLLESSREAAIEMSDSKLSLDELRENLRRMQAFIDNSPTAAFMKDAAGRYVYCNSRMQSMFYTPVGGLEGKTD